MSQETAANDCNSFTDYRCERASLAHQCNKSGYKNRGIKILHFLFLHPDDHRSFCGPGWKPLLNFGTWDRRSSMTSLWFVSGCWGNSTDNNTRTFVLTYFLPSCGNNSRPLSNASLAVCALFWCGLASPVLDKHCFENQNSPGRCALRWTHSLASAFPSATRREKRLNRLEKRSMIKMDSVQLAIDFPAGLCFRHLCKLMRSQTLGTGISYPTARQPTGRLTEH